MGNPILDYLTTYEAEVTREIDPPKGDLAYGSDLACLDDIGPNCEERSGDDPILVLEAIHRRVTTERATLLDDQGYGDNVARLLHLGMTPVERVAYQDILAGEAGEDDRVKKVQCEISDLPKGLRVRLHGTLVLASGEYAFSLTMVCLDGNTMVEEMHAESR